MGTTNNKYITVAYQLYTDFDGKQQMVEEAPEAHPFQFISGFGTTLDAFEAQITPLAKGDTFNFTLSAEEAYGEYDPQGVIELSKEIFTIDGKFDTNYIYPGAVVPLMSADGERFNCTVTEIGETGVTVDLNHPYAGKALNYVGTVTENREATNEEIVAMLNMLSGEGCGCGKCGGCGGCGDDCDGDGEGCGCSGCH